MTVMVVVCTDCATEIQLDMDRPEERIKCRCTGVEWHLMTGVRFRPTKEEPKQVPNG